MMKTNQAGQGWSRRRFLKYAALAGGAAAAAGLGSGLAGGPGAALLRALAPGRRGTVRLVGAATAGLGLEQGLAGGLRLYWEGAAGWGGAGLRLGEDEAVPEADEALATDDLGVMIGVVGATDAARLRAVVAESGTSLVVTDGGANVVRADEASPNLLYSTGGYWQANWALGEWAAAHLGRRGFLAASMYESGFDALYAAELGMEAGGGAVAGRHVNFGPSGPRPAADAIAAIRAARPDFVFAAYNGPQAVEFVRAYAQSGLKDELPLVGSGFLVDEALLPEMGDAALGIHSALSWAPTLDAPANQAFVRDYRALTGSAPNVLAAVGYDTARWISEALSAAGEQGPRAVRAALLETRFAGPRGAWRMDPRTQQAVTPLYLRQVEAGPDGPRNQALGELPAVDALDSRLEPLRQAPRTGWVYAYPGA
jgi:branched-chain amino acid transport system substrate-binding protein